MVQQLEPMRPSRLACSGLPGACLHLYNQVSTGKGRERAGGGKVSFKLLASPFVLHKYLFPVWTSQVHKMLKLYLETLL